MSAQINANSKHGLGHINKSIDTVRAISFFLHISWRNSFQARMIQMLIYRRAV